MEHKDRMVGKDRKDHTSVGKDRKEDSSLVDSSSVVDNI